MLQEIQEKEEVSVEPPWEYNKKIWADNCEEVLGKKKRENKDCFSARTEKKWILEKERKAQ